MSTPSAIAVGLLALISLSAPFGTTIFGAVAIAQINRSDGKFYGLRLALTDALLFPLILLDLLIMVLVATVVMLILVAMCPNGQVRGNVAETLTVSLSLIITLPLAAWIDFLIARRLWRAVTGQPTRS